MSFSTRAFIQYVIEHSLNLTRLLQKYYIVSIELDIFALTTRCLLAYMPELDDPLCELFSNHENIGQGMTVLQSGKKFPINVIPRSLCTSAG